MIRILIVDDHKLVGEGTKNMLEQEPDFDVTYLIDIDEILKNCQENPFDIYLFDMNMPNYSGLELAQKILSIQSTAKIILYTGFEYLSQFNLMMELGVCGIVSKSASQQELLMSIRAVLNGYTLVPISLLRQLRLSEITIQKKNTNVSPHNEPNISVSQKEIEILEGIAKGVSNKKIAEHLFMSTRAVEYNITKIYKKLKVNSRSEAVAEAVRRGIIHI